VELDDESSYLTTFETPYGKYRWKRMPFGISPAPEEFQRRLDNALAGLPGVVAVHDDIIVFGKGATEQEGGEDHDKNFLRLLQRCREQGIKLNKDKVEYKQKEISYLGHILSRQGLKPDPKKISAVQQLPTPEDKQAIQRLLGVVGYLQKFAPNLSDAAAPLRELVKKNVHFRWDEHVHGEALKKVKHILSQPPVLRYFDTSGNCKTTLQCGASKFGLGACLMQDGQPIQYASRAMTETEKEYAQLEKEMLAILFGLERFERYVYGRNIEVETDHKPLETIHKKSLLSAPKRIQRMLLRTQKFQYNVVYKRGTEMYLADTLSRAVSGKPEQQTDHRDAVFYTELEEINALQELAISEQRLVSLQQATQEDAAMNSLMKIILQGWPEEKKQLSLQLQDYFPYREELAINNGLVFKGHRVVVPEQQRRDVMEKLHASHSGIQSCLRRAREVVFWPGMNSDLEEYVRKCSTCNTFQRNQQKEPLISTEIPELPWQHIACDIFELKGNDYLVTVDHYSDFFEIDRLKTKESREIIRCLKAHMARHGIPERLSSDNGTQFSSSQFQTFSQTYGFEHVTSSPTYPQSNGKAESAVKAAKTCLKKAEHNRQDPFLALLELRNIPTETINSSPTQRLFGRRTRTQVPISKSLLEPAVPSTKRELEKRKQKQAHYYNRGAVELAELKPGQIVKFRPPGSNKWVSARVDRQIDIRCYNIRTEDGRKFRRNRRQLRETLETEFLQNPFPEQYNLHRQRQRHHQAETAAPPMPPDPQVPFPGQATHFAPAPASPATPESTTADASSPKERRKRGQKESRKEKDSSQANTPAL
jgi:transposase InsO family protein